MKNTFLTLIAIVSLGAISFAQQPSSHPAVFKTCKGEVESISVANPKGGTPAEITVLDAEGQMIKFVVKPSTAISDEDDSIPSIDKIGEEDKVIIEYTTTKEGMNVAESIKSVE